MKSLVVQKIRLLNLLLLITKSLPVPIQAFTILFNNKHRSTIMQQPFLSLSSSTISKKDSSSHLFSVTNDNNYHDNNHKNHTMQQEHSNNYECIHDNFGLKAYQYENIRLQAETDPCLLALKGKENSTTSTNTQQQIWKRINDTIQFQNQFSFAKLYTRKWRDVIFANEYQQNYHDSPLGSNNTSSTKERTNNNHLVEDTNSTSSSLSSSFFSVLQFNTLAEGLSSGADVPTPFESECCNSEEEKQIQSYGGFTNLTYPNIILDYSLRRWRLLEVILADHGDSSDSIAYHEKQKDDDLEGFYDILALEEMDRFHGFFEPMLTQFGYQGIFVPKGSSPSKYLGYYSDGCALFYKTKTFELLSEQRCTFTAGSQVYIIATLRHKESKRVIIVTVTHLKAKMNGMNEQIRTIQAEELVNRTQEIASLASLKYSIPIDEIPMLIMGDFNADTHGEGGTCIRSILERNWTSVYPTEPESSKSLFSTWKIRGDHSARRVIDYMFYNAKNVRDFTCTNILLPPDDSDIEPGKLPGMRYPSDHIALGARFAINHTTVSK